MDCLLVPMHVKALFLPEDKAMAEMSENFTHLPYSMTNEMSIWTVCMRRDRFPAIQNQNLYIEDGYSLTPDPSFAIHN